MIRGLFSSILIVSSAGLQLGQYDVPQDELGAPGFVLDLSDSITKTQIPEESLIAPSSTTCFAMEYPPYSNVNGSLDEGFGSSYPFTLDEINSFPAAGLYDARFKRSFDKFARTKSLTILVLGGSETAGVACNQKPEHGEEMLAAECAWSARLRNILEASSPGAKVNLINLAHGGTTTSVILGGIGLVLKSLKNTVSLDSIDFVFIDTLCNDAQEATAWGAQRLQLGPEEVVSLAYEKLVRVLSEVLPGAMIFSLIAGCPLCKTMATVQQKIIDHYQIPSFDYGAVVARDPSDSRRWNSPGPHPDWMAHQLMADMIASVWKKELDATCVSPPVFQSLPDATLGQPADLDKLAACVDPLSGVSAFDAKPDSGTNLLTTNDGWKLMEDRPGKPGWISESQGSTMRLNLTFGKDPRLVVQYLRSYENMGNAFLRMNGHEVLLQGLWNGDNLEKVSQSFVAWFDAGANENSRYKGGMNGFGIEPYGSGELEIVSDTAEKFKIIEISSC
eukprot:TRINITY_DN9081_c0_g1_i1.p1 TRINITY_DN9081_c0_g1~~TRINITY_DN9081_c0_g1_i1.p1  ORF type:complete len:504 (+),score=78.78 TRINITY_DN9081_c0_g1_i1:164-1675(+)